MTSLDGSLGTLLDKMADNLGVTAGTLTAPLASTTLLIGVPVELTSCMSISLIIFVRCTVQAGWHKYRADAHRHRVTVAQRQVQSDAWRARCKSRRVI